MRTEDFKDFRRAVKGSDHDVDLFGASLIISRLGGHRVDPHRTARQIDLIAEAALEHAGPKPTPDALAHAIDYQLFSACGFRGDSEHFNDPRNSYLDLVVDRKLGIPISLSLLYMEVAQRIGLQCDGVGYPGHFIVRIGDAADPVFVDPFQQGARIDREELLSRLRAHRLGGANPEIFLSAVTRRQILQRMLNNLLMIFREQRDLDRWYSVLELQICLEPWNANLVGERGMLHYRLGRTEEALVDLEAYVSASDRPAASPGALRLLDQLRLQQGGMGELR
jgi:regulator of sirC expression with transglutaminase-like and TPR domain